MKCAYRFCHEQLFSKLVILISFFIAFPTHSASFGDGSSQLSVASYETDQLDAFVKYRERMGYADTKFAGFDVGGNRSITYLVYENQGEIAEVYTAVFSEDINGGSMSFMAFKECVISYTKENPLLLDRIITVNGQRIQVVYACAVEKDAPSGTSQIYMPKSVAGKDFIRREFIKKHVVFVELDNVPIPFSAEGFTALWNSTKKSAL